MELKDVIKAFSIFLLGTSLTSCQKQAEVKYEEPVVGKYIYRDDNGIHHIDANCFKLRHGKDDRGHEIYSKHPIDTAAFIISDSQYFRICSRCVNDKHYEHMLRISARNQQTQEEIIQDKIIWN